MADRAGLAGKPAALDRRDDVILAAALGDVEHLVDDQPKRRPGEIDFLVAAVDDDLAGAGLQPDPGDRVLAAAGGVGAALLVELLLAKHGLDLRALGGDALVVGGFGRPSCGSRSFGGRRVGGRSGLGGGGRRCRSGAGQLAEVGEGLAIVGHQAPTLFLRFMRRDVERFGILAAVRMLGAVVEVKGAHLVAAQRPARDHPLDGLLEHPLREAALEHLAGGDALDSAGIAGVACNRSCRPASCR